MNPRADPEHVASHLAKSFGDQVAVADMTEVLSCGVADIAGQLAIRGTAGVRVAAVPPRTDRTKRRKRTPRR